MRILKIISITLFFVLVAVLSVHSLNSINQDIGRHLKSGQIIWETGSVYKTNLFSFTEPDHPFINHHWLSEVVFFLLNGLIGLKGLIIFKAGVITAAFWLIYQAVKKQTSTEAFLIAGLFGLFVFSSRTDVRPEIFSYLFLAYFLFAIFRAKYSEEYRWLYALPIIQIFWTNSHIYFALGPGLLLFFLIDRFFHNYKDGPCSTRAVLVVFALTSLATLINPNFIRGALAPLTILRDYGYSVVENQSVFFLTDYGIQLRDIYLFELSLIALIVSFVIAFKSHKKIVFEFLAVAIFTILAGKMIRNFGPYALVFLPITALNLAAYQPKPIFSKRNMQICLLSVLILAELLLVKWVTSNGFYRWAGKADRFGLTIPIGAQGGVDFVKNNGLKGPVFNNFEVGSFLIWKLYPQEKVFVDGRPEAYGVEFFEKIYKPMQLELLAWQKLSQQYNINYVFFDYNDMTPWGKQFLNYISQDRDWPMIYLDTFVVIFIKKTPENSEIIRKHSIVKTNNP